MRTDGSTFPENLFPLIGAGLSIATASWLVRVLPAPFRVLPDNTIAANEDLLAVEPSVAVTDTGQIVTYELNPEAVWSDGEPITVEDGESTVVVTSGPFADWRSLFTTLFPAHVMDQGDDAADEGYEPASASLTLTLPPVRSNAPA